VSTLLGEHNHDIHTVLVSPRDDWAVATDWRGTVVLYDLAHGQPPKVLREEQPESDIACVDFDHTGQTLFIHAEWPTGRIDRWDVASSSWMPPLLAPDPSEEVGTLAAHPRQSRLAVATKEGICIWDPMRGERLFDITTSSNHRLLWLPSGDWLISLGAEDQTITAWAHGEKEGLTWVRDFRPVGDMVAPLHITAGRSGNQVFTGGGDSVITRWDVERGEEIARTQAHTRALGFDILEHHTRAPYLLSSAGLGELTLWDSERLERMATVQFPCRWEEYRPRCYRGYNVGDSEAAFAHATADVVVAEKWHYDYHGERLMPNREDLAGHQGKGVLRRWSIDELMTRWEYPMVEVETWAGKWMGESTL
jgi:WD40 repeat protein